MCGEFKSNLRNHNNFLLHLKSFLLRILHFLNISHLIWHVSLRHDAQDGLWEVMNHRREKGIKPVYIGHNDTLDRCGLRARSWTEDWFLIGPFGTMTGVWISRM